MRHPRLFRFALLIAAVSGGLEPIASAQEPQGTESGNSHRIEACLTREKQANLKPAVGVDLMRFKNECLKFVTDFEEFALLARPVCDKRCPDAYYTQLGEFILEHGNSFIGSRSSIRTIRELTCSAGVRDFNVTTRVEILRFGIRAIRTQKDWLSLTEPVTCTSAGEVTPHYNFSSAVYRFRSQHQRDADEALLVKAPDTLGGAAQQLISGLESLKTDFPPIFTPTFAALLESTNELRELLPTGEHNPEVRSSAQLVSLFSGSVSAFCQIWETSPLVKPICTRMKVPLAYLTETFQFDKSIQVAMKARVARAAVSTLKRLLDAQDVTVFIRPIDLRLGQLFNEGRVAGDAAPGTRAAFRMLLAELKKVPDGQKISVEEWLTNKESSTGDEMVRLSIDEALKQIASLREIYREY